MAGLTLFLLGPTGVKHAVDVTPDASVGTLAEEAARVFDVPVASVRLSWQGRELGDRREALADAGVCNQSMLEVQTRRIRFVECGAHLEIQGDYHVGNCDEGHSWCKTDYCFTVPDDLDQLDESASLICKADGSAAIHMCGFVHHGFGLEDGNNTVTCSGGVAFAADGRVSIHGTYVSAGETWYRTGDTVTCAVRDRKALLLVNGEERRAVPITEKEFTPGERMVLACSCYRDAAWEAC
eukprot:TRINITY_DN1186_c0_g1_i4.p1 TRINITY_DN1186_c0_g1~~TRINITY_DN1186_c0_g1_i4.p1  ORF type:complete len:258 (+),score=62.23 TRINITY_DN1186_c0_g1_i4:59-775(+)